MALSRAKKPAARRPTRTPTDVALRITLDDIEPPMWREITLHETTTLPELHRVIPLAFLWYDYHLYQFTIGTERYTLPDEELDDSGVPARNARGVTLSQLCLTEGANFTYEYDFADSWNVPICRMHTRQGTSREPAGDGAGGLALLPES